MMNYRKSLRSDPVREDRREDDIGYEEQLGMLIDTLQFVLRKLGEVCRWQTEQEGLKRKKSMLRLFDKNIDSLPSIKAEAIEVPIFDEFPKIIDKLELYKNCLPQPTVYDSSALSHLQAATTQQFSIFE
jgi:hypothetical protein